MRSNKLTTIAKATSILDSCGFSVTGPNSTIANSVIVRMVDPRREGVAVRVDPVEFTLSYQLLREAGYTITPLTTTSLECGYSSSSSSSLSSINLSVLQELFHGEQKAYQEERRLLGEERQALQSERELLQAARQAIQEERQAFQEEHQAIQEERQAFQEERETLRTLADQLNQVHNLIANNNNDVIINIPDDRNNQREI